MNLYEIGPNIGPNLIDNLAKGILLQTNLYAAAFTYLRTELQLGYVVFVKMSTIGNHLVFFFLVQGSA